MSVFCCYFILFWINGLFYALEIFWNEKYLRVLVLPLWLAGIYVTLTCPDGWRSGSIKWFWMQPKQYVLLKFRFMSDLWDWDLNEPAMFLWIARSLMVWDHAAPFTLLSSVLSCPYFVVSPQKKHTTERTSDAQTVVHAHGCISLFFFFSLRCQASYYCILSLFFLYSRRNAAKNAEVQ